MKIALQAVINECNRLAAEAENQAMADALRSRIAELEVDLARGAIDEKTYSELASKILSELPPPATSLQHGENMGE